MTFKYRFILFFVLIEIVFITLIVTMNFVTINDSSKKLTEEKIQSNIEFLDQLFKVPISIYDLATLDNLVLKTSTLDYVNSLVLLDSKDKILSKKYSFKHIKLKQLLKTKRDQTFNFEDETYEVRYKELIEDEIKLGSFYIIFDTSENFRFIKTAMKNTGLIILLEILLSTILSYVIGSRLTIMLTKLSKTAKEIGEYKYPEVPYQNKSDEIGILAKSMAQMLIDLKERNEKLKNLARELNLQKNELIKANKSKDDFLANMSHELKTPLNSINVISSVMMKNRRGTLEEEHIKNLSIINKCGKDLLYLINDILDLSKLEAGELVLNYDSIDFNEMMSEIKDMFELQIKQKNLEFIYKVPNDITYIYSDKNRVGQIIKNLLSNALKFTEKGSISLCVNDLGEKIEIIVEDQGIGIEKEKIKTIFDRFKQADEKTNRKFGGTGLGLAICKELSLLLGGDIFVKSKIAKGTLFKVEIPKRENEVDKSLFRKQNLDKKKDSLESNSLSEEVLLLNSDPISFMNIVVLLKRICSLEQVNDLSKLISLVENRIYKYVIIDLSTIDVEKIIEIVKKYDLRLILIIDDENVLNRDIKNHSVAVLKKPIKKEELIKIIEG